MCREKFISRTQPYIRTNRNFRRRASMDFGAVGIGFVLVRLPIIGALKSFFLFSSSPVVSGDCRTRGPSETHPYRFTRGLFFECFSVPLCISCNEETRLVETQSLSLRLSLDRSITRYSLV